MLGFELAGDPDVDTHRANGRSVARTRSEGEAIEYVMGLLVRRLLARCDLCG